MGIITCLNLLAMHLVIQSRMLLANFIARELLSASTPRAIPAELLPEPLCPQPASLPGALPSQVQDLAFVPADYLQILERPFLLLFSSNP